MLPWLVSGAVAALAATIFVKWHGAGLEQRHRETEAALSRERAVLKAVLDAMDEGVIVTDPDAAFVVFNPAAQRIIGRGPAPVDPSQWSETYAARRPDEGTRIEGDEFILLRALRGEEPEPAYAFFRHEGSGTDVHVRAVAKPVRDLDGNLLGAAEVLHDITGLKLAEEERLSLIEDLERRNRELERFSYAVSHELRSPLVTIRGFVGLLARRLEASGDDGLIPDIQRIDEAARIMNVLLDDLLRLSRSGAVIDTAGNADLQKLVEDVIDGLRDRIDQAGAEVVLTSPLPTVVGDARRLSEVFQNLIENALKFTGDQTSPRVEVSAEVETSRTVCYVRDNGIGIEEEHRDRVFRTFERLDATVEGTGVGLALVQSIVEAHGGTVWVETGLEGVGSSFVFTVPGETQGEPD